MVLITKSSKANALGLTYILIKDSTFFFTITEDTEEVKVNQTLNVVEKMGRS